MVEREKSGADRKGWLKSGRAGRDVGVGGHNTAEEEMERKKQGDTLKLKWLSQVKVNQWRNNR